MALPSVAGSPVTPTTLPGVGQQSPPGAAPPGPQNGVTMPTANRGLDVAGLTLIRLAADILIEALSTGMDPASDPGKEATKAISNLSKHTPPGSMNPAIYNAALMKLMMKNRQAAPQRAAMASQGQQMPQPGAGAGASPASMAPPPSASSGASPMPQAA